MTEGAGFGWPGAFGLLLATLGAWLLARGAWRKESGAVDGSRSPGPSRRGATGGGRRAHRCVLVSTLGTLLEAGSPEELAREGPKAAVRAGEAEALKACARSGVSLFLMTQCLDEASEARAVAAFEACGLLGTSGRSAGAAGAGGSASAAVAGGAGGGDATAGAVPRHRALFCSTLQGKVAMARQLEVDLYVDCEMATLEELRRFNVKVLRIERRDGRGAPAGAPSGKAPAGSLAASSLEAYFLSPR